MNENVLEIGRQGRQRQKSGGDQPDAHFRAMCELAPVGMAQVGLDGMWLWVNPQLSELLGYSRDELVNLTFQQITHPDDLGADLAYVEEMLANQRARYQMEKRYIRKDGSTLWVSLTVSLARDADGAPNHFISVVQDISHEKRLEADRARMLNVIAHELNTPLTSLSLRIAVLRRKLDSNGDISANDLDLFAHEADRLARITSDLALVSHMEQGDLEFHTGPVDLRAVCATEIETQRLASGREIIIAASSESLIAQADEARIAQAITNLLTNAIKYSPEGTAITVTLLQRESEMLVSVFNQGPGIPARTQAHLFDPYYRAPSVRGAETPDGQGLGLYITRILIERQGGRIGVDSVEGEGARFWFTLPLTPREVGVE